MVKVNAMICPYCQSPSTKKNGKVEGRQRYHCNDCGKNWRENPDPKRGGGRKPKDKDIEAIAHHLNISHDAARMRVTRRVKQNMTREKAIKDLMKTTR